MTGFSFCRAAAGLALALWCAGSALAVDLYVSPAGDDTHPGTLEKPLATLEEARDLIRRHKGARPVTVHLRAGTYLLREPLTFAAEDSGTQAAAIVYRAYQDETVRLVGGRVVAAGDFRPVTDAEILGRLAPAARGKIVELDLAQRGVRHAGPPPDLFEGTGGLLELYFNNQRMPLARWPNDGYTTMQEVVDGGAVGAQAHGGAFRYRGDRAGRWIEALPEGVWIAGFWRVPWVLQAVRVQAIDPDRRLITQAVGVPGGIGSKYSPEVAGTRRGDGKEPWYATNLLEETRSTTSVSTAATWAGSTVRWTGPPEAPSFGAISSTMRPMPTPCTWMTVTPVTTSSRTWFTWPAAVRFSVAATITRSAAIWSSSARRACTSTTGASRGITTCRASPT
jgi:hypothetical protein